MGWNRHAHPNESSVGCVFCVPEVIFAEVSAVKSTRCPLCLPKLHADVVEGRPGSHPGAPRPTRGPRTFEIHAGHFSGPAPSCVCQNALPPFPHALFLQGPGILVWHMAGL